MVEFDESIPAAAGSLLVDFFRRKIFRKPSDILFNRARFVDAIISRLLSTLMVTSRYFFYGHSFSNGALLSALLVVLVCWKVVYATTAFFASIQININAFDAPPTGRW